MYAETVTAGDSWGRQGYGSPEFVTMRPRMNITLYACRQTPQLDGRTARPAGWQTSQRACKPAEEVSGCVKAVGGGRKLRFKRIARNGLWGSSLLRLTVSRGWRGWL